MLRRAGLLLCSASLVGLIFSPESLEGQEVQVALDQAGRIFEIARNALPFFLILVLATAILSIFPEIALWLPSTMMSR
jgi:hypothetical protein